MRYRLLPYIYSLAWMTTSQAYTPMRPLVMDFRTDVEAANIGDQFMFGPAFLVSPVTDPAVNTRPLYLPAGRWYDFWSGVSAEGPHRLDAAAPLERLPLYLRAGSIVPLGPPLQWSMEKPEDPIEIRVYPGADGEFTLYEDENDNYDYEKGVYATITLRWEDARQELTIGERKGEFPGMLKNRTFRVVVVREKHGTGILPEDTPDRVVPYSGQKLSITPVIVGQGLSGG